MMVRFLVASLAVLLAAPGESIVLLDFSTYVELQAAYYLADCYDEQAILALPQGTGFECPPGLSCGHGPVCTVELCELPGCADAEVCLNEKAKRQICPTGIPCGMWPSLRQLPSSTYIEISYSISALRKAV